MSSIKIKIEKSLVVWCLLIAIGIGAFCWYGFNLACEFFTYKKLSAEASASVYIWGIDKLKEGKFVVYAKYFYTVNGQELNGKTVFKKNIFPNQLAAKDHLHKWQTDAWTVYYDPYHPENSSLQRPFPLKILLHMLITLGVSIYFLYLRRYLSTFSVA